MMTNGIRLIVTITMLTMLTLSLLGTVAATVIDANAREQACRLAMEHADHRREGQPRGGVTHTSDLPIWGRPRGLKLISDEGGG
jgi:hypothetical protein